jgi:hypothetical protein
MIPCLFPHHENQGLAMVSAAQALFLFGHAALANRSIALTAWRVKPMTQKSLPREHGRLGAHDRYC